MTPSTFEQALTQIKHGRRLRRNIWREKTYIYLEEWTAGNIGRILSGVPVMLPCLVMATGKLNAFPGWQPKQSDMLAEDWEFFTETIEEKE